MGRLRAAKPLSDSQGRLGGDLGGAAGAFFVAAVLGNLVEEFTAFEWSLWAVQAILTLSLTLAWGYGGIFSFGQAAIYGVGGYTYGFWAINLADNTGETITAVLAAVVVGAAFAALLGYFMFYGNVTDVYVAIITLATSLVLFAFVNSTSGSAYRIGDAPFGGFNGMPSIPRLTWRLPGGESQVLSRVQFFLVVVAAGLLIAVLLRALRRRPFGRVAVALQHNETRTRLLGYDVRWHKLIVFTLGGAIAAFGGALFAAWGRFINPSVFALTPAALVVIWAMVGGRASVTGAFIGVLVVEGLSSAFGGSTGDNEPIVLGVILIAIVLGLPGGIVPNVAKLRRALVARFNARVISSHDGASTETQHVVAPPLRPLATSTTKLVVVGDAADGPDGAGATVGASLSVEALTKQFGGLRALNGVTLEFPQTGVSCLIGPNGAGKSTLFGLLSGQLSVSQGAVRLDGDDITRTHPFKRARAGIGIKLQVASIYKELSTRENLWLACFGLWRDVADADRRSTELLDWLALTDQADRPAGTLSHGEQQWLEIGMVVATDPKVVLLDEPTAGMTREETERTAELVTQLGERASVIVVEHDMNFVRQLDAPVTVLHVGSVFLQGSFAELSNDERVVDIYLGRESAHAPGE